MCFAVSATNSARSFHFNGQRPIRQTHGLGSHDPGISLQCVPLPATIVAVENNSHSGAGLNSTSRDFFLPGALVIATLCNPREKFWGMILALAPHGLSLSGAELASFDNLTAMVRDGEPFTPAVVFFPMHRIERLELDLPDGSLPSLAQRFHTKTGKEPAAVLAPFADQIHLRERT